MRNGTSSQRLVSNLFEVNSIFRSALVLKVSWKSGRQLTYLSRISLNSESDISVLKTEWKTGLRLCLTTGVEKSAKTWLDFLRIDLLSRINVSLTCQKKFSITPSISRLIWKDWTDWTNSLCIENNLRKDLGWKSNPLVGGRAHPVKITKQN